MTPQQPDQPDQPPRDPYKPLLMLGIILIVLDGAVKKCHNFLIDDGTLFVPLGNKWGQDCLSPCVSSCCPSLIESIGVSPLQPA
jgi:hypothetical protein